MSLDEKFKAAAEDSKKLTSKPSNEELLDLYGMCLRSTVFRFPGREAGP